MAKRPIIGPDWSQLWTITAKLAGQQPLDSAEQAWLCELLNAIGTGEDVSKRFNRNAKARPKEELHFWIACDVAQHIHSALRPAHSLVAKRWNLSDAEAAQTIAKRQRLATRTIQALLGPSFAKVIEWHRVRLLDRS